MPAAALRDHSYLRSILGTYRAPAVYGPREDGRRALKEAPCG
jgi:hypothetical protein